MAVESCKVSQPYITRERKHFSKIHESHCKPLSCLACSYLYRVSEVSDDLCSSMDRTNDKSSTVALAHAPRVNE